MSLTGIDIGAQGVRVALVDGVDDYGVAQITRAAEAEFAPGADAVVAGRIRQPGVVADALAAALKRARIKRANPAVVGVTADRSAVARHTVPAGSKPHKLGTARLASVVRTNAGGALAPQVPDEHARLSAWADLRTAADPVPVLVGVVGDDELAEVKDIAARVRVPLAAVDLHAAALLRGYLRLPEGSAQSGALVDLGASQTTVAVHRGGVLLGTKTLRIGGDSVTSEIMSALDWDWAAAEGQKHVVRVTASDDRPTMLPGQSSYVDDEEEESVGVNRDTDSLILQAAVHATEQLLEQVAGALESLESGVLGRAVDGIALRGGGARLGGFKALLQERVGRPCQQVAPQVEIADSKRTSSFFDEVHYGGGETSRRVVNPARVDSVGVAAGLALWEQV